MRAVHRSLAVFESAFVRVGRHTAAALPLIANDTTLSWIVSMLLLPSNSLHAILVRQITQSLSVSTSSCLCTSGTSGSASRYGMHSPSLLIAGDVVVEKSSSNLEVADAHDFGLCAACARSVPSISSPTPINLSSPNTTFSHRRVCPFTACQSTKVCTIPSASSDLD